MSQAELEILLRAAPPVAPERLRARVRELRAPARGPAWSLELRRLAVPALAAMLLVVVGAAVVHGLVGSNATRSATPPTRRLPVERGVVHGAAPDAHALQSQARPATGSALAPDTAAPPAPGPRLTQYLASLRLRVDGADRLGRAVGDATRVARSLGGYAASVDYRSPQGRPAQAFLELRIPTGNVQTALARLGGLGTILSQRISTRDLQNQLERQTAQIAQLRSEIRLTLAALRDPSLTPVQRIELQLKLNAARRALSQRLHARKGTIAAGTLARVSLVLTTQQAAAAAHHESRLGRMLGSAASFLGLEATVALYVLIVASPLLPFALAAWWLRRRRDERLLAVP